MSGTSFSADLTPGKIAKVYKSADGVTVTIVPLMGGETKNFIVTVEGTDSRLEDLAMLQIAESEDRETAFYTFINDDKFFTLVFSENTWGGKSVMLSLPEAPMKKISLKYNDKDSKKVDPKTIVKKHEDQIKDGSISRVELSDEKDWKGHVNGVFRRSVNNTKAYCGNGIGSSVDWDSVDRKLYNKIPLASMCRRPADALSRICKDDSKKSINTKVSGITCVVSSSQALSFGADKRLIWKVPSSGVVDVPAMEKQLRQLID
jgi:hypothetical protein